MGIVYSAKTENIKLERSVISNFWYLVYTERIIPVRNMTILHCKNCIVRSLLYGIVKKNIVKYTRIIATNTSVPKIIL